MKVNREQLLKTLIAASCGLTAREILEQSNAFVFTPEHLITFNGEILTRIANPLPGIEGAVSSQDLMKLLAKFPDVEVDVVLKGAEVVLKGKRRSAGITRQADIQLPYEDVPRAKKWQEVPEVLMGVLRMAARVCGKDETQPRTTEVHITPDAVEACDNFRLFRYETQTGFDKECLIPAASVECLSSLVFTHATENTGWVHFKTATDHEVSVRCSTGEYPDLSPLLAIGDSRKIKLPKNLSDILSRAEIMQESSYDAVVHVSIEDELLTLKATKQGGWFKESKKIRYKGEPLAFQVHPKFLEDVISKTNEVLVGENRMRIEAGEAVFVVCLEVVDD